MRFLLHLKPWALFALGFGLPLVVQVFSNLALLGQTPRISMFLLGSTGCMLLFMGTLFGWLWAVGSHLAARLPASLALPTRWLKWALAVPGCYILSLLAVLAGVSQGVAFSPLLAGLIVPLHLLSMGGIFYSLYFVARTLKTVELQRPVGFGEFLGEFFLIWFFPIGVWLIQPRINRLFSGQPTS